MGERRHWKIPGLSKLRIGGSVGQAGNWAKEHLPSVGSMIGTAVAPGLGTVVGSGIEGATNGKGIGAQIGQDFKKGLKATPFVLGGIGALGGLAGAGGAAGAVGGLAKAAGGAGDGVDLGSLLDAGLGTAGLVNASQLSGKSDKYAESAYKDVNDSFTARAPLRAAGIQGMLNPGAGVPLKLANVQANTGRGNPFAKKPGVPL